MSKQFYLQDSRSNTGDGLMFWALGGGYTTNLDKAELFTQKQAYSHRETDIPWPKDYVDARAHLGVDHQYINLDEASDRLRPGCIVALQIPGHWNGNDIAFARWPIGHTYRFEKAHHLTLEAADAIGNTPEEALIWPLSYLEAKARRLVHQRDVSIEEALQGTGIEVVKLRKQLKPWERPPNCQGCGRFISWDGRFLNNCKNCGGNNCP
ncbi:hypothetical protein [Pseudomonas farsensis]|uniref:Uncharacterized protein n=1 Tax=Pseudomonas farsensis TaxID=2745492 RepID=A0ABU8QSF9_9PSED